MTGQGNACARGRTRGEALDLRRREPDRNVTVTVRLDGTNLQLI